MCDIESLGKFLSSVPEDFAPLVGFYPYVWCLNGSDVCWVEEGDKGTEVYESYMMEYSETDEYLFANCDTGTGFTTTNIYHKNKEITYDYFCELYGDYM